MTLELVSLIALFVLATTAALYARLVNRERNRILARIGGAVAAGPLFLTEPASGISARIGDWIDTILPNGFVTTDRREHLVQAGFGSTSAPPIYAALQVVGALGLAIPMFVLVHNARPIVAITGVIAALAIGVFTPSAVVEFLRRHRQDRIRRGLPDALDLLLVCVEAGVSLDAAILRVGRELTLVHPELAWELLTINRKQNAGMPREDALRGVWNRTGVEEVRALMGNMIQSEQWGTSIARVLRVYSEAMRRKRREAIAKRAALASIRMIFPLALLILPALLAVIGGPTILTIRGVFDVLPQ